MPTYVVTDWENGPMGPGFFILFPRHDTRWFDGGNFYDYIYEPKKAGDEKEKDDVLFALFMLMREQP